MTKFKKKPVVIEAIQLTSDNKDEILSFCKDAKIDGEKVLIDTLEGTMEASIGDFIIKGVKGEFYPCKPDIFNATYNAEDSGDPFEQSASLMLSKDYKDRFKAEYIQLRTRYDRLKAFVEKWDEGNLTFTPTCPRETYNFQLKAMREYLDILKVRARIEEVEL